LENTLAKSVFQAVSLVLAQNQALFNALDETNHNHGDHMVEIFAAALLAAEENPLAELPEQMGLAGRKLQQLNDNGSAPVYADGLICFSHALAHKGISQDELTGYVENMLADDQEMQDKEASTRSGEVLKALVQGLADWNRPAAQRSSSGGRMDLGALFELGMAYLQAKQRGGTRVEILADAAVSASPLNDAPYRYQSGKLVVQAILQTLADMPAR